MMKQSSIEDVDEEIFPGLPACIALDILSRIPSAKELTMLKSVSKSWFKSISDTYFQNLHTFRSDRNPPFYCVVPIPFDLDCPCKKLGRSLHQLTLQQYREIDVEFDVTLHIQTTDENGEPVTHFTKPGRVHEVPYLSLISCNKQLICMSTSYRIYICNPGTQDFIELPKGSCDPFCSYNVGFGYLPGSNEYKVVRLFFKQRSYEPTEQKLGCEVMTISASTCRDNEYKWRVLEDACPYSVDEFGLVSLKGSVFWAVEDSYRVEEDDDHILTFDLEKEKFGILLPPPIIIKADGFSLVGAKDKLYFVEYGEGLLVMNMWILKDLKTSEWSKEYSITYDKPVRCWFFRRILDITEVNGEEVILIYWNAQLYYYHVENKSFSHLGYGLDVRFCYYHDSFFPLTPPITSN